MKTPKIMTKTKHFLTVIGFLISFFISAQNVNIPDARFKTYLVSNLEVNTNGDTEIQVSEAEGFIGEMSCNDLSISDLSGIESFTNIISLNCKNNNLTSLDLSALTKLSVIDCSGNNLTILGLNNLTSLAVLDCYGNNLTILDLNNLTRLAALDCSGNNLTSLDINSNIVLNNLDCSDNDLASLDLNTNVALKDLDCSNNNLTSLNLTPHVVLNNLNCNHNNLTSLDISANIRLTTLYCSNNNLASLNLRTNTALIQLGCRSNSLESLDLNANTNLEKLYCSENNLTSLDLSTHINLSTLYCFTNNLTNLNLANGNNATLTNLILYENPDLSCVKVDDVNFATENWVDIDKTTSYSTQCVVGLDNELVKENLIFPNPVIDIINVQLHEQGRISLYNQTGKEVFHLGNLNNINLEHLESGLYFYQIETSSKTYSGKILKD